MEKRIVIIGAGPTGLGAAYRLQELGYKNWLIYEKNDYIGGLAASFKDKEGFTWDIGGHVVFSHYPKFDKILDEMLRNEYLEHLRESWIWILGRWVPYPFQNNIRYLPKDALLECILGLVQVSRDSDRASTNFQQWIHNTFGSGIAKYFLFPYNRKVWAYPLDEMAKDWIAERVSVVDIERVLHNVIYEQDDVAWGPNATFRFPLHGGTGEIFRRFRPLIEEHLQLNKELVSVDPAQKKLLFADGSVDTYDTLINTSPLDLFVSSFTPRNEQLQRAAIDLRHNSVLSIGLGFKQPTPSNKCWMYFPQNDSPFYRCTYFSNYSYNNVPGGDTKKFYSLMCETSYSEHKPESKDEIIEKTIRGLVNSQMIRPDDRSTIISEYLIDVPYGYPVPSLGRDAAVKTIQPALEKYDIYSRGRFGAWRYEVGNMDHSVMQGVEVIDRILNKDKEPVFSS